MRIGAIISGPEGYLVLFSWVFAEQIGLPIPAAPALLAAGALASAGSISALPAFAAALSASIVADYLWYLAGALKSTDVDRFLRRRPDLRILRTAEHLFEQYGSRSLIFAKFIPGLSLAAPPLSGMCGMPAAEFLLFDMLGAFAWIGAFMAAGYFVGGAIELGALLSHITSWIWALAALAVALAAAAIWRKRRKQDPCEIALRYMTGLSCGLLSASVVSRQISQTRRLTGGPR